MPTALITGASSGIGLELASLAAQEWHDLVLVARQRERLESIGRGLAEEYGVVLGAPRQHLDDPLDLVGTADDRVELALAGQLGQVAAETVQGGGLRLALAGLPFATAGAAAAAAFFRRHIVPQ